MVDILPTFVGYSSFSESNIDPDNPESFTLDIPAATKYGDLMIASIMTYPGTMVAPGRGLVELAKVDDPTLWNYGVWAGYWDGDTTPLAWQGSGFNNAFGQYYAAFLAVYRNKLDPARPPTQTFGPTVPGLPAEGPALCINWFRAGFTGVAGHNPFEGTDWILDAVASVNGAYVLGSIGYHGGVVGDQTSTDFFAPEGWPYVSFGVTGIILAPPCRLHPREDQLGVGSGRIWPPPKSQQASPRRAGGYY